MVSARRIIPYRAALTLVVVLVLLSASFSADNTPAKMTHVIVRMSGTDIPTDSFAAKPKVYWRAGSHYCRVDEEPDSEHGIHGRTVINEPDAWLINLADHTAKYILDRGPTFNCRLPIFASDPETTKGKLGELEFGRELEFFRSNEAEQIEGPQLEFKANYYELTIGDLVLRLVERVDIHAPGAPHIALFAMCGFSLPSSACSFRVTDQSRTILTHLTVTPLSVRF